MIESVSFSRCENWVIKKLTYWRSDISIIPDLLEEICLLNNSHIEEDTGVSVRGIHLSKTGKKQSVLLVRGSICRYAYFMVCVCISLCMVYVFECLCVICLLWLKDWGMGWDWWSTLARLNNVYYILSEIGKE